MKQACEKQDDQTSDNELFSESYEIKPEQSTVRIFYLNDPFFLLLRIFLSFSSPHSFYAQ